MAGNLLEAGYDDSTFYRHSGHTTTIESTIGSPIARHRGIAWDGTNLYMVTDLTSRAYRYSGWSSTVSTSFATPSTEVRGCYVQSDGDFVSGDNSNSTIYEHSGFSTTIRSTLASPSTQVWGITYDGTNLITIDNAGDDIYIHSGWTTTITTSFNAPSTSPSDITWDGANIITADYSADTIYIHSGKTSTITATMAVQGTAGTGIADDNPSAAATPVESTGAVSFAATTVSGGSPPALTPVGSTGAVSFSGLTVAGSGAAVTGTIYYVDQSGGSDAASGTATDEAWKTLAKVSGASFSPGDWVLLKRGETWREQLTFPSSGTVSDQITIGAYGSGADPKIRGSNLVGTWSVYSGNVWRATLTSAPSAVFADGTRGIEQGSIVACISDRDWYWSGSYLYIYSTSDPDSRWTSPGVEATIRDHCVRTTNELYVTVQDLDLAHSDMQTLFFAGNATGCIADGLTIKQSTHHGLQTSNAAGQTVNNVIIRDCTISYCSYQGIMIGAYDTCNNMLIDNCVIHHCAGNWDGAWGYTGGIKLWGDYDYITNATVQNCEIYSNGWGSGSPSHGVGLWWDECGNGNVTRYNLIYDNDSSGIMIESCNYQDVYYNVCYENGITAEYAGDLDLRINTTSSTYNEFYNNTTYGGWCGIYAEGEDGGSGPSYFSYNSFKNNICTNHTYKELFARWGASNSGYGTGNVYTYNCLGTQYSSFIYWGGSWISTYSAFNTAYGSDTHSVQSDPDFVNAGSYDFRLNPASNCINAGTGVGLTVDYAGNPITGSPDVGAYEFGSQSSTGAPSLPALEVSGAGAVVFKPPQAGADSAGTHTFPALEVAGGGPVYPRIDSGGTVTLPSLSVAGGGPTTPRINSGGTVVLAALGAVGGGPTTPRVDGAGTIEFPALAIESGPERWITGGGAVTFSPLAVDGGPPAISIGGGQVTLPALAINNYPPPPRGGAGLVIIMRSRRRYEEEKKKKRRGRKRSVRQPRIPRLDLH